ncbi:unnamed protein product [Gongylonema pulchrum]|uniref:DM10 domain-containing protein n=1 Tax=Gongylonema pulchrum TaxID=637853 RepID=A0A183EDB2_9BILA|nr:unnamed protein product [Gongylonema pulchrum]
MLPIVTRGPARGGVEPGLIHPLQLNIWHQMDGFRVMLLDANHIPDSVMFVFEGERISMGRVLFTGDFRADNHNVCPLKRKIYVDDVRYEIAEILGLSEYFTTNRDDASIWACNRRNLFFFFASLKYICLGFCIIST